MKKRGDEGGQRAISQTSHRLEMAGSPGGAAGAPEREMTLSASPASAVPAIPVGALTIPPIVGRTARIFDRVEPLLLPSLGKALVAVVALMATLGLILSTRWPAITADEGTALSTAKAALSGNHQWIDILAPPAQVALYLPFVGLGRPALATAVPALFGALVLLLVVATARRIPAMPW